MNSQIFAEKEKPTVETIKPATISTFVYESLVASHERTRRWFIATILVLVIAFVGTNAFWIYQWTRYDTIDYSYSQDGEGSNIIGNSNEVNQNGTETPNSSNVEAKR